MANENCLRGLRCPKCGGEDRFQVVATSVFTMVDDGTEDHRDVEYDDTAPAYCANGNCDWQGVWGDLEIERQHPDYMDQKKWDKLSRLERQNWMGDREIVPYPAQLAPYYHCHIEVVTHYDETRKFWVGCSAGWNPCYLELPRRDSEGGEACESQGYKEIKLLERR